MLTSDLWQNDSEYRRDIFRTFLKYSTFIGFSLVAFYLYKGKIFNSLVSFIFAISCLLIIYFQINNKYNSKLKHIFICLFITAITINAFTAKINSGAYFYLSIIPFTSYLLFGVDHGKYYNIAGLSVNVAIVLYRVIYYTESVHPGMLESMVVCIVSMMLLSHFFETNRSISFAKLQKIAAIDPLTGLNNRRHVHSIFTKLTNQDSQCEKLDSSIVMILIDLDHFKTINDKFGHRIGDEVLTQVSQIINDACRSCGWAFRFGGEEFCLLIPDLPIGQEMIIAERLRSSIENCKIKIDMMACSVTASLGVACWPNEAVDLNQLYELADQRLYKAKNWGRNQVVVC